MFSRTPSVNTSPASRAWQRRWSGTVAPVAGHSARTSARCADSECDGGDDRHGQTMNRPADAIVCGAGAAGLAAAAIAATGYRRGLEGLVGHLDVLDENGVPTVSGGRQHPSAPGLFFNGYRMDLSGQLRLMRFGARQIAGAVRRELAA